MAHAHGTPRKTGEPSQWPPAHSDGEGSSEDSNPLNGFPRRDRSLSISRSMHSVKSAAAQLSPPDGGFGWVVVFGSFLIHVVADGVTYSFGALLPILLDVFKEGESATSAVGSTLFGVTLAVGPIAGALVNRHGCRMVTCVGGVIATIGTVISMFSPNIAFMTVSFGIITGFGLGLIYLPAIVSVTQWFEVKRSFATGIAVCGSGFGTFIFGPLTAVLIEQYYWDGCLLIIAGILFNCCVFGALFRPVEYESGVVVVQNDVHGAEFSPPPTITPVEKRKQKISTGSLGDKYATGADAENRLSGLIAAKSDTHIHITGSRSNRNSHLSQTSGSLRQTNSHGRIPHGGSRGSRLQLTTIDNDFTEVAEVDLASPFTRKDALYTGSLSNIALFRENPEKYKASVLDLSKATVLDASGEHKGGALTEDGKKETGKVTWWNKVSTVATEMMDPSLLKDWVYIWFSISNFFTSLAFQVPYIFLPDRAEKQLDITNTKAAWLLGIVGIANIVGRIAFGYMSDKPQVNKLWLYNIAVTIAGSAMCVSVACTNFESLAAFAAVFGIFIGAFVTLTPVLLVDLFGLERLTNAFGILLLFQGIATFIGPPLAGALKEMTDTYESAFIVFGVMMAASGAMLFLIPCVRKLENSFKGRPSNKPPTAHFSAPKGIAQNNGRQSNKPPTAHFSAPKGIGQNNGPPAEQVKLLREQDKTPERPDSDLVVPVIQLNDRQLSAYQGEC